MMRTVTTTGVVTVWTTCHVVAVSRHPASVGLVMWRCHIVVVVGVQWWFGASNNGHGRWSLLVVVVMQWRWSR